MRHRNVTRRDVLLSTTIAAAAVANATIASADEVQDTASEQTVVSSAAIDFLYVDSTSLTGGETQNVVVSLSEPAEIQGAELALTNLDADSQEVVALTKAAGPSLLFAFEPAAEGAYEVARVKVSFEDGSGLAIDFSDCDSACRSFSVASAVSAFSVEDTGEVATEFYASDSEGALVQGESIESVSAAPVSLLRSGGEPLVVALDPGHVGVSTGTVGVGGTQEASCTWKIAQYCRAELESYANVSVVYTVSQGDRLNGGTELQDRVDSAVRQGADVLVSLHLNAAPKGSSGQAYGAEVWYPHGGTDYNYETHTVGGALADKILAELERLGLYNRGAKVRDTSGDSYKYEDGSKGDYYGIIRNARKVGLPAIIVEHAFLDNSGDYSKFLSSDEKLRSLGVADATGIANCYGLVKASEAEGTVTMYRLYNPNSGEHFYTASAYEKNSLIGAGWEYEGKGWTAPKSSSTPVFRMYNRNAGDHHYTTSEVERDSLRRAGWEYEGIGWYSDDAKAVSLYRQYNPHARAGAHNYTTSAVERDHLLSIGWNDEGIAWYGMKA